MSGERGPYLTPNRALALERRLAQVEAAANAKIARLDEEVSALKRSQVDQLRAITRAFMDVLRDQLGQPAGETRGGTE